MRKKTLYTTLSIIFVIAVFAVALLAVLKGPELYYSLKYREEKIIGMSSQEVIEKYGEFHRTNGPNGPNAGYKVQGLWRNCWGYYRVHDGRIGYQKCPQYFAIYFNEEGIATKCEYDLMTEALMRNIEPRFGQRSCSGTNRYTWRVLI